MNEIQVINHILKMEDELDLFNQQVHDIYFWERMRYTIFNQIKIKLQIIKQPHRTIKLSRLNKIKIILKSFKNFILKNPIIRKRNADILFFGHQRRKLENDGYWWDIYTDPIIEMLEDKTQYKTLSIELFHNGSHLTPAKTSNLYYLDYLVFKANIRRIFIRRKFNLQLKEVKLLEQIQSSILFNLGVDINIKSELTKIIINKKSYVPLFEKLLTKTRPKIAVVVASYSNKIEYFIDACRNFNIKTIELQHGIISPYQLGYSYKGENRQKRCFVDYLFTFGEFWKENVEFPISNDLIFSMGFSYFEAQIIKYKPLKKQNYILIVSQGTVGDLLVNFAIELSQSISELKIVYKLHPSEKYDWKANYQKLYDAHNQEKIRVIDGDDPHLYELFATSQAQIGVSSAALIEGLAFELPTYVIQHPENIFLQDFIDQGIIHVISSSIDFMNKFSVISENDIKIDGSYYFETNALDNIKDKIEELMLTE